MEKLHNVIAFYPGGKAKARNYPPPQDRENYVKILRVTCQYHCYPLDLGTLSIFLYTTLRYILFIF